MMTAKYPPSFRPERRRSTARCIAVATLCVVSCAAVGCRTSRPTLGPYGTAQSAARDTITAQRLTHEAADLIDTNPQKAEHLLKEALGADVFYGPAHNNLGAIYLQHGQLYEAANEFEWARKLLPGHPDPRMNLALTLEEAGRIDDALQTYHTALEVFTDHMPTKQAILRLQLRYGLTDNTTPQLMQDVALRGTSPTWREWAKAQSVRQLETNFPSNENPAP